MHPVFSKQEVPFSLDLCLHSGQSFAWRQHAGFWIGNIRQTGFVLQQTPGVIRYLCTGKEEFAASALRRYFALDEDQAAIIRQFPKDPFLHDAVRFCAGLRILHQDPWECLAGFILSSAKQIVHIQQIRRVIAERWGRRLRLETTWRCLSASFDKPLTASANLVETPIVAFPPIYSFPSPSILARVKESELRACRMGFRAPYLRMAARAVADGRLDFNLLAGLSTAEARERLMFLKGVGQKIADCVLLFGLGKAEAFPLDTWMLKMLRRIYFARKRRTNLRELRDFASNHFGAYGGHAQQYLFHYVRMNPWLLDGRSGTRKKFDNPIDKQGMAC